MPGERLITRKAPEKVKQVIIRELQEFASRATYKGYGVFDVDALVLTSSASYRNLQNLPLIYAEEQDYPQLLAFLQRAKRNRLELLMQYAVHLKKAYPKEVLELFTEEVRLYAGQNTGRPHYEYVARVMKKMSGFKQGKAAVQALADDFRIRYRRRPAMLEVLGSISL